MSSMNTTNSIETIKSLLDKRQGIQRANRYAVKMYRNVGGEAGNASTDIFYPSAVSFGARATNFIYDGLQGYGYGRAVPNSTSFVGGIVLTFLVTGDLYVLNYFNDWFDLMYQKTQGTSTTNFVVPFYDDSVFNSTMELDFLDLNGYSSPGKSNWQFKEVYPVECMPLELSAKVDTPLMFQVVMRYREVIRSTGLEGPPAPG